MDKDQIFLKVEFQQKIEEAEYLYNLAAPEETPYDNKYKARTILEALVKDTYFDENVNDPRDKVAQQIACKAIIFFKLGNNYSETEENNSAETQYRHALELLQRLENEEVRPYLNILQEIYNIYGLLSINREENEMGLSILAKSKELYTTLLELPECQQVSPYQQAQDLPESNKLIQKNESKQVAHYGLYLEGESEEGLKPVRFEYCYKGGVTRPKTESLYTHTLFYLAQAHTKLGNRELAAQYCGETMKRQHATGSFQLKDLCVNCISLAEYYQGIGNFAQAQYLLLVGESVIPQGKKKKLHATFQMSLGRMMLDYLDFSVQALTSENKEQELQNFKNIINKQALVFDSIPNITFPHLTVPTNIEDAKSIFRQSNTQLKRSLEYFKLDGFVTEHIQIVEDQNSLYKKLTLLENDNTVVIAMLGKRAQLLEPIFNELNPKAYIETWQKLLVEIAEIYNDIFNLNFSEFFLNATKAPKSSKVKEMNTQGEKAIGFFDQISSLLLGDKDNTRDASFYHSVVNAKFNAAKIYSKLFRPERKDKIDLLTKSLNTYKWISNFIKTEVSKNGVLDGTFSQELKMCNEMIELLPAKIDKIASQSN